MKSAAGRRIGFVDLARLVEIVFCLGFARLALALFSFRRLENWLGLTKAKSGRQGAEAERKALRLGWLVEGAGRRVPWRCTCFVNALAGKLVLGRRGLAAVIRFGVSQEEGSGFAAHAWLQCGEAVVTGARERASFEELRGAGDG